MSVHQKKEGESKRMADHLNRVFEPLDPIHPYAESNGHASRRRAKVCSHDKLNLSVYGPRKSRQMLGMR